MIELNRYQQNKSVWLNENQIESMEAQTIRDGNGDTKSSYVDVYMVSGRMYRVEDTIKDITGYIWHASR
jgi:Tfp pilus assembly protein PilV